jgi:predicted ATPase
MIVKHLKLKNWKNFKNVSVDLTERVFLAGPNASGKSNFLDAFRFLRDIAKPGGGLQNAVSDRGGISKIRCLSARQYPDVEIEVVLSDDSSNGLNWKYGIGIKQETRGYRQPYITYEYVSRGHRRILDRPTDADEKDQMRKTETHLEQINANQEFREIAKVFSAINYLHVVPQLVRNPEAFSGPNIPGDPFGRNFLERLAKTNERTRRSRLKKIEIALRIAVPQLRELAFTKDETGFPHLEAVYDHWRPKAGKQREDQFSDGTLRLIGLLWSLLEGESLLLLEEPELSLNGAIVSKLAPLIYRLQQQRKRQVIISTHSFDLLSERGIGPEEVLLLKPTPEGTEVVNALSSKEIVTLLEGGMTIGDAIMPHVTPEKVQQFDLFK